MNTHFISASQRLFAVIGAVLITTTLFASAAATAQPRGGAFYRATLSAPTDQSRAVAGSVVWNCADASCTAPRGTSRPAIMCARLARELGPVTSFVAGDQTLTADELARCNAAA